MVLRFFLSFLLLHYIVDAATQNIDSTLTRYNEELAPEKVYVHFDKPIYNSGETVWFKAYLLARIWPSDISKNFYAELIDEEGTVLQRKAYPVYEGTSAGNFDLPVASGNTNLTFRGYTTWMLNFDTAFLFTKTISLRMADSTASLQKGGKADLRFFPEGGNLVSGIESVVAFKAAGETGLPKAISGVIKNNGGSVIMPFKTVHDGMGKITFIPVAGETYYAEWQNESGATVKTNLPPAQPTGVVLTTRQNGKVQTFMVKRPDEAADNLKTLYVYVQMHQQMIYKARVNLKNAASSSGNIPVGTLPSGMLQITVLDEALQPLAERIAFWNSGDHLFSSSVTVAGKNLQKRGKNILEVEVPDSVKANLSLSVTDALASAAPFENNIISGLLLTSDLRGYIHQPFYYFSSTADSIKEHLDLVMLTNGWRRYNWKSIAAGLIPKRKYEQENYLSVKGKVVGLLPSEMPANAELNAFIQTKDSSRQFITIPIGKDGSFSVNGLIFFDTVRVFYQFNNNKLLNRRASVLFQPGMYNGFRRLNTSLLTPYATASLPAVQRNSFLAAEAANIRPLLDQKIKMLEGVTVRSRTRSRSEELDKKYASGLFSSGDAVTFDFTDNQQGMGYSNIMQYLQGRVAGLQVSPDGQSISWRGQNTTLFLNEMQVDASTIGSISVNDVAYIKAFRPPFFGATGGGAGGAVAIYTKKGNEGASTVGAGLEKGLITGYSPVKEFYSPDYATSSPLFEVPDVRSTLYWKPYILTDKANKKVKIEFYNNDVSRSLRIVLEGVNEDGRLTRIEKIID